MAKAFTLAQVAERLAATHPETQVLTYRGKRGTAQAVCPKHGIYECIGLELLRGSVGAGCRLCSNEAITSSLLTSRPVAEAQLAELFPSLKLGQFSATVAPCTAICCKHGEFESPSFKRLLQNVVPCPTCRDEDSRGLGEAIERFHLAYPLLRVIRHHRTRDPAVLNCQEHGEFEIQRLSLALHRPNSRVCPECVAQELKRHQDWANYRLAGTDKAIISWNGFLSPATAVCEKHGIYTLRRGQVVLTRSASRGCPACTRAVTRSGAELEVEKWIASQGFVVESGRRDLLGGRLEVDMFLPELRFGVEFHGIYHHSEKFKDATYHQRKAQLAAAAGIRLVQVFCDEWRFQRDLVQQTLLLLLGKAPRRAARQLQVVDVTPAQARAFYTRHHLQGFIGGRHLGLADSDTLLACATIGPNRFASGLELRRYATAGVAVVGGLARLMKALTQPGDVVTSYCDLRWFTGKAYLAAGFVEAGVTPPGYFWIRHAKRFNRFQFQKQRIQKLIPDADLSQSETEIAAAAGYRRLWDAGHLRFQYTRS